MCVKSRLDPNFTGSGPWRVSHGAGDSIGILSWSSLGIGNWGLGFLFRILFRAEPGDLLCGFKSLKRSVLPDIFWRTEGYFVETEIAVRAAAKKLKAEKVKIPSIYHDPKKGTTVLDGLKLGWEMIKLKIMLAGEKRGIK